MLYAFKICFDQIFVVSLTVIWDLFQQEIYQEFSICGLHHDITISWKKNIPLFLNPYPFNRQMWCLVLQLFESRGVAISCTSFIVLSMQSTFLSLLNLHRASSLHWGGGLPYLAYKRMCHFTIKVCMVFKVFSFKQDVQLILFWIGCCFGPKSFKRVWRLAMGSFIQCLILYQFKL